MLIITYFDIFVNKSADCINLSTLKDLICKPLKFKINMRWIMQTKELLGLKIKELRKQKKLTQEKLAEILNLDIGYVSKLEVGRNFPTIGTLQKIADALDVELYELFQFTEAKENDFKTEIIKIYDKLNKEKQYTLYRVARDLS